MECTSQVILGSSDQRNVSASLFLKSEKIPALLYVGKGLEHTPFHDFRSVPRLGPFSYSLDSSSISNNEIRAFLGGVLIEQNSSSSFKSNSSKKTKKTKSPVLVLVLKVRPGSSPVLGPKLAV